jgi:subfamily B ATP-binding cassette protein MsbA
MLEKISKGPFGRIIEYGKPYTSRFISALACMGAVSVLNGAVRILIKPMIDSVFIDKKIGVLYFIAVAIPAIYLLLGIFNYIQRYLMSYIANRITLRLRDDLYGHLQDLSLDFHTKKTTGGMMSRITNDINAIQAALNKIPAAVACDGLTVIVLVGILFYLNWKFALIGLAVFPLVSIPIVKFGERLRHFSRRGQQQMANIYSHLQESFSAINITKAFGTEKFEIERFKGINKKFYDLTMRFAKTDVISSPVMELIGALAISLVLFFAAKDVINGVWTAGSFFAFFGAAFSVYQPLRNFAQFNPQIQQAASAAERISEIFAEKPAITDRPGAEDAGGFRESIEFKGVSFSYTAGKNVLDDINFSVRPGEVVAIVGPSGSGKSTMVNLLLRFYDVTGGGIILDGRDIRGLTLESLRRLYGLVTQDTILFNESVRYNIAYGKPEAVENEILAAADATQAHGFIQRLPHGYDTVVGERGVFLSGGERQRIAIARALIRNPKILLLDEATSALDAESERLVQEALEILMEGRTTILIAHRLATVKKADRIIVLDSGKIVDAGTHDELFRKEGLYKRLHHLQLI